MAAKDRKLLNADADWSVRYDDQTAVVNVVRRDRLRLRPFAGVGQRLRALQAPACYDRLAPFSGDVVEIEITSVRNTDDSSLHDTRRTFLARVAATCRSDFCLLQDIAAINLIYR